MVQCDTPTASRLSAAVVLPFALQLGDMYPPSADGFRVGLQWDVLHLLEYLGNYHPFNAKCSSTECLYEKYTTREVNTPQAKNPSSVGLKI